MHIVSETSQKPKFYTPREFHEAMEGKVGLNAIYDGIRTKEIRHLKLGRKILILPSEVDAWPERIAVGDAQ